MVPSLDEMMHRLPQEPAQHRHEELEKAKGRADPDILAQPDFADGASRGQRHGKSIHGQGHSQQKNSKK